MKKIVTATLIPALVAIAVIGSGFSVFYFGNPAKAESELSPEVEGIVTTGGLKTPAQMVLNLDQTIETRKAVAGEEVWTNDAEGIYLKNKEGNSDPLTITYTRPNKSNETDDISGTVQKLIHTYVLVPKAYTPFITIKQGTGAFMHDGEGLIENEGASPSGEGHTYMFGWTLTDDEKKSDTTTIERRLPGVGSTSTNALFTFEYAPYTYDDTDTVKNPYGRSVEFNTVATNEPTNATEYAKMKDALKDAGSIKIVTYVTFANAAA